MAINPFQGFEFHRSAEILEAQNQQFKAALSSGDQNQMRAAIFQQLGNDLSGGTPVFKQAKKTETILKDAMEATPQGEDDIVNQINFQKRARQMALDANLPDIAMQATTNLAALESAQEERARLKNTETRTQEAHDMDQDISQEELKLYQRRVLWDPETGESIMAVDLKNPDDLAKVQEFTGENPNLKLVSPDEVFQFDADMLLQRERLRAQAELEAQRATAGDEHADIVGIRKYNEAGVNQISMLNYANQTAGLLEENPGVFTSGNSVASWTSNLATQGRSLVEATMDGGQGRFEELVKSRPKFAQITDARKRALVMNFAYALATSREGGRLTDQDIDRAIVSLGFLDNPDPRAILTVMLDNVTAGASNWESRSKIGNMKVHSPSTYAEVQSQYNRNIATISNLLESYGGRYDFSDGSADEAKRKASVGRAKLVKDEAERQIVEVPGA
jgi:hypothetical protein